MVVNAMNINRSVWMACDDSGISARKTTISTAIDEGTLLLSRGSRHTVLKDVRFDLSYICVSVDRYLIFLDLNLGKVRNEYLPSGFLASHGWSAL